MWLILRCFGSLGAPRRAIGARLANLVNGFVSICEWGFIWLTGFSKWLELLGRLGLGRLWVQGRVVVCCWAGLPQRQPVLAKSSAR